MAQPHSDMIFDLSLRERAGESPPYRGLVIEERDLSLLEGELEALLEQCQARSVLLVNRDDGSLIAARGLLRSLDTTSLAALAAGAFASSGEIARLIGEPEFSVLFHEGRHAHIHVSIAGEHGLLMTIFGDSTTVGLVRLCARETSARVASLL